MQSVRIKAHAKINLTLEIVGREQGFHMLDSLVASVDLHDLIVLKKRKDKQCTVTMIGGGTDIPMKENGAWKAAKSFCGRFSVNGVDITVYKKIPIGAGLGGSSADVAGVLQGMAKLYEIDDFDALCSLAEALGSDTKYMLYGGFARMQGRGEKITPLDIKEKLHLLLLCPSSAVHTGACYQKYDELPKTLEYRESQTEACIRALQQEDVKEASRYLTNDLFVPAVHLNADVESAYRQVRELSPLGAVMTGSGSCVLATYATISACRKAARSYQGPFCVLVTETL